MTTSSSGVASAKSSPLISLSVGVLIASYQRPDCLIRCLTALAGQTHSADEIILVLRSDDDETRKHISVKDNMLPLRIVSVAAAGTVAARNAGLDACTSDLLCIIDDDTQPHQDWIACVRANFVNDPTLGGLGGKDRCFDGTSFDEGKAAVVGKIQWHGRMIGNHHLGFGDLREVDFLKGANMSFRAIAVKQIRFDRRLRGKGAQPREDTAFSIAVKASGWKLAYDPNVLVDHYAAQRDEERHYVSVSILKDTSSFRDFAYNDILSIWPALSAPRRFVFAVWTVLVGTGVCPGFIQAVRYTPRLRGASWQRFYVAQQGKFAALHDLLAAGLRT